MTSFEFFTVAISLILGLGFSRLLLGFVYVFRARRSEPVHWVPLAWALGVFLTQVQFWWALFELTGLVSTWTLPVFFSLLLMAVNLFVMGALVLPNIADSERDSLLDYFEQDGRWALVAITTYSLLAQWANWYVWGVSPLTSTGAFAALFGLTPLIGFLVKNIRTQGIIAVIFLLILVYGFYTLAPLEY